MCADGDLSPDNAECVKETARCVLETLSPLGATYEPVLWEDLLVLKQEERIAKTTAGFSLQKRYIYIYSNCGLDLKGLFLVGSNFEVQEPFLFLSSADM